MQIIDTFSGIGGFSLAGKWMGWRTVQFCEINEFCNRILKYYWPDVPIHKDIKTLTSDQIINNGLYDKNETTILTGGVPCQPWSVAGKRKGTEDDRNLWPQVINLIGKLHPNWCVLENVPGLINWSKGLVFEQIQVDLETEGYEVQPIILPACSQNAPHKRDRIWFIAHSTCRRERELQPVIRGDNSQAIGGENSCGFEKFVSSGITSNSPNIRYELSRNTWSGRSGFENGNKRDVTNPDSRIGYERGLYQAEQQKTKRHISALDTWNYAGQTWENFPTQPPICSGDDGVSPELAGITVSKHRKESLKAYGNAIVPQVAFQIFKAIEQCEKRNQ